MAYELQERFLRGECGLETVAEIGRRTDIVGRELDRLADSGRNR